MSIEQQRIIDAQQKQIKQLTKELSTARQTMIDAYDTLPKVPGALPRYRIAVNALKYYLEQRGLLR